MNILFLKYSYFLFLNASNKKRNPTQTTERLVNIDEETRNAGNKQIKIVAKK
tara:strand:- start:750 stop:905 length:156 start_codon:yes stop_codon:yes gene_type:complete